MKISVKKSGAVFCKDIPSDLFDDPVFNTVRGTDLRYTGWRWIGYLKSKTPFSFADPESIVNLKYLLDKHKSAKVFDGNYDWVIRNRYFKFPLWDYQVQAAMLMMQQKRFYLSLDVGEGKTLASIAALIKLKEDRKINSALVLCQASLVYQWKNEIHSALKDEFRDLVTIQVIKGTPKEREKQYEEKAFIYLMTYESFLKDVLRFGALPIIHRVGALILDEAWKIKNHNAEITKALKKAIPYSLDYRIALNATPVKNKYLDLFGVYSVIDPFLFISFENFSKRYMTYKRVFIRRLRRHIPIPNGYKNIKEIEKLCYPSLFMKPENYSNIVSSTDHNIPMVTVSPYWIDLNPSQRILYQAIRKDKKMNGLEKCTRARICCLGIRDIKGSSKFLMLKHIIEEIIPHKKIVAFCESLTFLQAAQEELLQCNIHSVLLSGKDSSTERQSKVETFRNQARILFMTRAGESGLNLQCADVVINIDLPWSPASLRQRIGRLRPKLGDKTRTIHVINILAIDTIEERIIAIIKSKLNSITRLFSVKQEDLIGEFNTNELEALL